MISRTSEANNELLNTFIDKLATNVEKGNPEEAIKVFNALIKLDMIRNVPNGIEQVINKIVDRIINNLEKGNVQNAIQVFNFLVNLEMIRNDPKSIPKIINNIKERLIIEKDKFKVFLGFTVFLRVTLEEYEKKPRIKVVSNNKIIQFLQTNNLKQALKEFKILATSMINKGSSRHAINEKVIDDIVKHLNEVITDLDQATIEVFMRFILENMKPQEAAEGITQIIKMIIEKDFGNQKKDIVTLAIEWNDKIKTKFTENPQYGSAVYSLNQANCYLILENFKNAVDLYKNFFHLYTKFSRVQKAIPVIHAYIVKNYIMCHFDSHSKDLLILQPLLSDLLEKLFSLNAPPLNRDEFIKHLPDISKIQFKRGNYNNCIELSQLLFNLKIYNLNIHIKGVGSYVKLELYSELLKFTDKLLNQKFPPDPKLLSDIFFWIGVAYDKLHKTSKAYDYSLKSFEALPDYTNITTLFACSIHKEVNKPETIIQKILPILRTNDFHKDQMNEPLAQMFEICYNLDTKKPDQSLLIRLKSISEEKAFNEMEFEIAFNILSFSYKKCGKHEELMDIIYQYKDRMDKKEFYSNILGTLKKLKNFKEIDNIIECINQENESTKIDVFIFSLRVITDIFYKSNAFEKLYFYYDKYLISKGSLFLYDVVKLLDISNHPGLDIEPLLLKLKNVHKFKNNPYITLINACRNKGLTEHNIDIIEHDISVIGSLCISEELPLSALEVYLHSLYINGYIQNKKLASKILALIDNDKIEIASNSAALYFFKGILLFYLGSYSQATEAFLSAFNIDSRYIGDFYDMFKRPLSTDLNSLKLKKSKSEHQLVTTEESALKKSKPQHQFVTTEEPALKKSKSEHQLVVAKRKEKDTKNIDNLDLENLILDPKAFHKYMVARKEKIIKRSDDKIITVDTTTEPNVYEWKLAGGELLTSDSKEVQPVYYNKQLFCFATIDKDIAKNMDQTKFAYFVTALNKNRLVLGDSTKIGMKIINKSIAELVPKIDDRLCATASHVAYSIDKKDTKQKALIVFSIQKNHEAVKRLLSNKLEPLFRM